jgi:hypothetical protein
MTFGAAMFDGVLPRDEHEPDMAAAFAAPGFPWELALLVIALAGALILAGLLFPEVLGDAGPRF